MAKLSSLVDKAQKKQRDRADELVSRIGTPENQAAAAEIQKKWETGLSKTTQIETELPDIGGSSQGFFDRLGDTVSGGLKGSGAGFTNFGGTLLESLGNLGSTLQDKRDQRQAAQDREYLAMYQKQLEEARAKGDAEAERIAQIHVNQAQYRLKNSGNLGDFYDEVNRQAVGNVYKKADELAVSSAQDIERAKQGTGKVGSALVDIGAAGTQLAGDIALGMATGVGAMAPIFVRGFGSGAQQARQSGATYEQQMAYGLGSATVEVLTERLASVGKFTTKAFGTGAIDDIMKGVVKAVEERGKTAAGKAALNRLASIGTGFVGEGMEEAIAGMVDPLLQRATYSDEKIDWQQAAHDAAYQFLIGGVLGGVMGGVGGTDTSSVKTAKPKSEAPSVKPAAETTTSPAAAPEVQQVQAQAEVTKAQNPEAEVLDAATTLFTQQGMNLKTAQTRAEIVGKLIRGEEVSDKDLNRIDPTSNQTKQIFTQLTGVQFPEGKIQIEQLRNLYRSAHDVAQAARVTMKEQAIQEIQQMSAEQIVERAKQARQATTPETDAQAAQILAQARGEIAPDNTPLLSYKDFSARHKQVFPDASPQETARMYDLYLKDNQTISFMGRRMTRQQVRNTLRSAPDGDKLTVAELDAMFDMELEAQSRDGKDATEHSVRNKEANNGRREDSVHSEGLSGQPDQRSGGQSRGVSEETGRAEGDDGARGETGTRRSIQGGNQEERQGAAGDVREKVRAVTLDNGQEVLEVQPEAYTPEMQALSEKCEQIGIKLRVIFGGYQIPGTDQLADGLSVLGSEIYVQADAVRSLSELGDHEFLHQIVFTDIGLRQKVYESLVERMTDEEFEAALEQYALEYGAAYEHNPVIMLDLIEEMAADAYAGLNRFGLGVVAKHQDAIRAVVDPWVLTRTETYRAETALTDDAGNLVVESDGQGHSRFSMSTYKESGRDILTQWMGRAVVNGDLTTEDADDIIDTMDLVYDICEEARGEYAPFDAWSEAKVVVNEDGSPVFSVVKANGDYAMNLDFSLVCKKRRTLDAVLNELVRRGFVDNLALNEKQIVKINELIRSYGFETACDLCFVDAKRYRQGKVADDFVKLYNDLVLSMVPKNSGLQPQYFNFGSSTLVVNDGAGIHELSDAELDFTKIDKVLATKGEKTVEYKTAMLLKNSPADRKLTMRGDFLSTRGFDAINRENPRVLKLFNSKKGSGGPKSAVSDVQYLNEVLTSKTFTPEKAYAVGGVRIQSFSDYVPRMVFDYVQMIADLAAKKLPAHSYTKEELYVKQFGLTGMKINMSLIPKVVDGGIAPGLDADGNYAWADESFDFEEAKKIQNAEGYSRNCGTIAVGVSDEHIRTLMADPDIRMVIPYHKSGLSPIVAKMNKIDQFVNYTAFQNTRRPNGKHGKKLSKDVAADKKLLDEMPDFNTRMRELGDPRAAAEEYVRWCEKHDLLPKFDQFAYKQIDGVIVEKDGQRVVDENYYKLLEDFTVYDNGKYTPQTGLTMTFPNEDSAFGSMKELIKRGLKEDAVLEGKRDEKVPEIVGEIMKFSVATQASEKSGASSLPDIRYSITPQFEEWYLQGFKDADERTRVQESLARLRQQYGDIPAGENPTRAVQMPRKNEQGERVHDTVQTVMEAEATPENRLGDIQKAVVDGKFADIPIENKITARRMREKIKRDGWDTALTNWTAKVRAGEASADLVAEGAILLNNAGNSDMSGEQYVDLLTDYSDLLHRTGQALQAARILKRLSPEGKLYGVQAQVRKLNDARQAKAANKKNFDPVEWAEKSEIKIDPSLVDAYRNAENDVERDLILEQIQQNIADQIPATLPEKLNTWRYLAMLGNFRTQIRNVFGNAAFQIPRAIKETVAGGIEGALSKFGVPIGRTRSVTTDTASFKAAWSDFESVRDIILTGSKLDEKTLYANAIDSKRRIYKNAILEGYRRVVNTAMDEGDAVFCRYTYADALARFMAANGTTWDQASEVLRERGRRVAIKEAAEATYRDSNAFSNMILKARFKNPKNMLEKGVNAVIEGILPFKKTPANILVRGIEYSPLGLIRTAVDSARLAKGDENVSGSDIINDIAKTITGSGLFALGYFMVKNGLLAALGPDDEDEHDFWELQGHQSYALEWNGKSYTIDWLAPEALPLLAGANTAEVALDEGLDMNAVVTAVTRITDPMLSMSMLQGVNDLLENIANTKTVAALPTLVANSLWSYGLQYVPTLLGQAERAADNTRRTTYVDKTSGTPTGVQYAAGKLSQKVPGWDYQQIPYIDQWGRMEQNYETELGNAFGQFLNPSYASLIDTSKMESEIQRVFDQTGDSSVLPKSAPKYFTVEGERRDITSDEYVDYATTRGQLSYQMLSDMVESDFYKNLDDAHKAEAISSALSYAGDVAKADILGTDLPKSATKVQTSDEYGISAAEYVALDAAIAGIESLKDADGETIENSKGLLIMEAVYAAAPNLTKQQYKKLFEDLGVGKTIRGYSEKKVAKELGAMRD